jgi:hypothetical protein
MVARMVHDYIPEDFDNVTHHRDIIHEDLADIRQFLKKIGEVQASGSSIGT